MLIDFQRTTESLEPYIPDAQGNCSSDFEIVEIVFIALPGNGSDAIELIIANNSTPISLRGATNSFGEFGYNLSLSTGVSFTSGDNFTIFHPDLESSHLRLLHQIGNESRKICWSKTDQVTCRYDHDYPLLAVETGNHNMATIPSLCSHHHDTCTTS